MTVAVEAAEAGREVVIVEKGSYLGGRVVQAHQYFPKLCPPYCGLEINLRRIRQNPRLRYYTLAEVERVTGQAGDFEVTIRQQPRYVNEKCTACDQCVAACPAERANEFNYGLDQTKAIYRPHDMAFPMRYVIDGAACRGKECAQCVAACPYEAIDLDMQPRTFTVQVAAVVLATGWQPYDATKLGKLGFGRFPNVITNVMMERLAATNGPTGGKILRPSDGQEAKRIAFVQCAGSRDENHLPYCSGVCCLASLKQATYVHERNPEAQVHIFYIDVRALGKLEDFYARVAGLENVTLSKGKVANVEEDPATHDLTVEAEDTLSGQRLREKADLVVLATGIQPMDGLPPLPVNVPRDEYGFVVSDGPRTGLVATGCARHPVDVATSVRDATGAALRAMQVQSA
jgi:quinone-modifying oxidoreductase subunit QmoA